MLPQTQEAWGQSMADAPRRQVVLHELERLVGSDFDSAIPIFQNIPWNLFTEQEKLSLSQKIWTRLEGAPPDLNFSHGFNLTSWLTTPTAGQMQRVLDTFVVPKQGSFDDIYQMKLWGLRRIANQDPNFDSVALIIREWDGIPASPHKKALEELALEFTSYMKEEQILDLSISRDPVARGFAFSAAKYFFQNHKPELTAVTDRAIQTILEKSDTPLTRPNLGQEKAVELIDEVISRREKSPSIRLPKSAIPTLILTFGQVPQATAKVMSHCQPMDPHDDIALAAQLVELLYNTSSITDVAPILDLFPPELYPFIREQIKLRILDLHRESSFPISVAITSISDFVLLAAVGENLVELQPDAYQNIFFERPFNSYGYWPDAPVLHRYRKPWRVGGFSWNSMHLNLIGAMNGIPETRSIARRLARAAASGLAPDYKSAVDLNELLKVLTSSNATAEGLAESLISQMPDEFQDQVWQKLAALETSDRTMERMLRATYLSPGAVNNFRPLFAQPAADDRVAIERSNVYARVKKVWKGSALPLLPLLQNYQETDNDREEDRKGAVASILTAAISAEQVVAQLEAQKNPLELLTPLYMNDGEYSPLIGQYFMAQLPLKKGDEQKAAAMMYYFEKHRTQVSAAEWEQLSKKIPAIMDTLLDPISDDALAHLVNAMILSQAVPASQKGDLKKLFQSITNNPWTDASPVSQ